ncbi:MAG: SIS domain-containing protein [Chloroflexota bacterium]|nr:SIS domain-containing protein [Chloroflexota bacterium]
MERNLGYRAAVVDALAQRQSDLQGSLADLRAHAGAVAEAAQVLVEALQAGKKVLAAGNGGSAAQAQHFAAELVGRFKRQRAAFAALALTTDTSILTAIGNDYGYADVFARQVSGLGSPGDVLLLLSTSGESENLVRAAEVAIQRRMPVIAITGKRECRLALAADVTVCSPAAESPLAQELHLLVIHILCEIVETELSSGGSCL